MNSASRGWPQITENALRRRHEELRAVVTEFRARHGLPPLEPGELAELDRHAEALERRKWPRPRRLTDEEREWVHRRIVELAEERAGRADAHRVRVARAARELGRRVARHEVTLEDAERRLDRLVERLDPETSTPIPILPYREAVALARSSFRRGYREARR